MLLKKLYVRFYKSFNYDYLKKASLDHSQAKPWEKVDDKWYPYVEIPIDEKVTTVVGANESGKSHLLSAIKKGITGQNIEREDFCRYSQFFTVTKGESKFPDFGFEWTDLSNEEQNILRELAIIPPQINCSQFLMFRTNRNNITIYDVEKLNSFPITSDKEKGFIDFLPSILPIQSKIALPDSVPIKTIIDIDKGKFSQEQESSIYSIDLDKWKSIHELIEEISNDSEIPCDKEHTHGGYFHDGQEKHIRAENLEKTYGSSVLVMPIINQKQKIDKIVSV